MMNVPNNSLGQADDIRIGGDRLTRTVDELEPKVFDEKPNRVSAPESCSNPLPQGRKRPYLAPTPDQRAGPEKGTFTNKGKQVVLDTPGPSHCHNDFDEYNGEIPRTPFQDEDSHEAPMFSRSARTQSLGSNCRSFAYEELAKATDNFSESNLLGQGGFGPVHKGVLLDGTLVAVKQLRSESHQGEDEFKAEIQIISRIHHRNLVRLVGFCIQQDKKLLAYEYMENNSLESHLHGSERPPLDCPTRMQIAVDAANGLAYLHELCDPAIIHRDMKSANILLDSNLRAKISDFGIAKCIPDAATHMTTRVIGTIGYVAPEYGFTGRLTRKSDVYSFGVVLIELITGKKSRTLEFVPQVKQLLYKALRKGIYEEVVDPKLADTYDRDQMECMIVCALACVDLDSDQRPQMPEILQVLDGTTSVKKLKRRVMGREESNSISQTKGTKQTCCGCIFA